jgi:hypothetical protein
MGKKKRMRWWRRLTLGTQLIAETYATAPHVLMMYDALLKAEKADSSFTLPPEQVPMMRRALKPYRELAQELVGQ